MDHAFYPPTGKIAHLKPELLIKEFTRRLFLFRSSGIAQPASECDLVVWISPSWRGRELRLSIDQRANGLVRTEPVQVFDFVGPPSETGPDKEMSRGGQIP